MKGYICLTSFVVVLACSSLASAAPPEVDAGAPPSTTGVSSPALEKAAAENPRAAIQAFKDAARTDAKNLAAAEAEGEKTKEELARKTSEAKVEALNAAEVRNGKLIEHGITGGVAVGVHAPLGGGNAAPATIPYIMLLPGYWGANTGATNAYCASSWSGGADATKAAQSKARKRAEVVFDVAVSKLRASGMTSCPAKQKDSKGKEPPTWCDEADLSPDEVSQVAKWLASRQRETDAKQVELRQDIVASIAERYWNSANGTSCFGRKVGVWVGRPLDYKSSDAGTPAKDRSITSTVAFGVAFAPNAYVSVLFGVTYGTNDDTKEAIWAISTGLGGNLDIATLVTK